MVFQIEAQELKNGLIIFQRADVEHKNWYCRVRIPESNRYKTISLKTAHIDEARDKAFEYDADIRFRIKHQVPIFEKNFAEVALEFTAYNQRKAAAGQITSERLRLVERQIRHYLIPFAGSLPMAHVGDEQWKEYPFWRKQNSAPDKPSYGERRMKADGTGYKDTKPPEKNHTPAKNGTICLEMVTFRAIMNFAADKGYIKERQVPKGRLPENNARREEFTPQEYRQLHRYAREKWINAGGSLTNIRYRKTTYNFMLIMANTGMRTMEARHLRWRDIDIRRDQHGREFVTMNVWAKKKYRQLVAARNVAEYLERVRKLSRAIGPDDFVFTMDNGDSAKDLYVKHMQSLLTESGFLYSSTGSRRSTYSFRHTYATFRLMEGVDVYFLAKQMGTSVQMIERFYGHITPAENAERILQGISGWEPLAEIPGEKPIA
jgi:integrase